MAKKAYNGGIFYQSFLLYFVYLFLLSLLSYSLFKMILILPLDMSMLKIHYYAISCSFHNRKLSKSLLIRHLFNFLKALNFLKVLNSRSNELMVKILDSQSRGPQFKTTGWLLGQLSLSSFLGRSVEYLKLLGTEW